MDHSKVKNKSPETKPKEMQSWNLLNKDFKTIFLFFFLSTLNGLKVDTARRLNKFTKKCTK